MNETFKAGWYPNPDNRKQQRYWDGEQWTDQTRDLSVFDRVGGAGLDATPGETFEINRAGLVVAGVGALLAIIGIFLPQLSSTTFFRVADNTLIQQGDGWIVLVAVVVAGLAVYRASRRGSRDFIVLLAGLVIVGLAIYDGTGDRAELHSLGTVGGGGIFAEKTLSEHASPGVGLYMTGAGGALMAIGGLLLAGVGVGPARSAPARRTKTCPDCAETVLADAKVCKHCGYRFSAEVTESAPDSGSA